MGANTLNVESVSSYRYRPVLFFAMAYLFTWIFWVPAIFVPQELGGIPLGYIITWVYLVSDRSILACMVYHLTVNFLQEKIAMTPETKCVETIVVTVVAAMIVIANKDMFFETRHVGRLLETRYGLE